MASGPAAGSRARDSSTFNPLACAKGSTVSWHLTAGLETTRAGLYFARTFLSDPRLSVPTGDQRPVRVSPAPIQLGFGLRVPHDD